MAVEYKPGMTKPELLELAVVNGIDVDDSMTKAKIIAAIDAHNAQEAAESGGEGNNTTPDENAGQSGAESATGDAGAGGGGNTATAGAQMKDTTVKEALDDLVASIDKFYEE